MPAARVARDLGITVRHVRRPWAGFLETGTTVARMGRPRACMTAARIRLVTGAHGRRPAGVVRTARRLRRGHDISYCSACRILKKAGAVAARVFTQATSENAVPAPRDAIGLFGTPATVLSDNGSCFVGRNGRRKDPPRSWKPTASGAELLDLGIELINSRPHRPVLMVGDDNESYQIKFNKPDDFRIGINELVCNLIGLELELPVFEPVIAKISRGIIQGNKDLEQLCPGEHFAQVYLEPFETVNSYTQQGREISQHMVGNISHVPVFIIFDKYVENFDRHGGNICLLPNEALPSKVDYYLFDHDLAFQRNRPKRDVSGLRKMRTKLQHMYFIVEQINKMQLFERGISNVVGLSGTIPEIIKKIPPSWKAGHEDYINSVEVLLSRFTERMAVEHVETNKDKLPSLQG